MRISGNSKEYKRGCVAEHSRRREARLAGAASFFHDQRKSAGHMFFDFPIHKQYAEGSEKSFLRQSICIHCINLNPQNWRVFTIFQNS
jgi:hypothetical protein